MKQSYNTKQRDLILGFLRENSEGCFSAKELYRLLSERGIVLGETTVYRTLNLLCAGGAVKRFAPEKGKCATFQYATENPACEHHLHLKCRTCGILFHAECKRMKHLIKHLEQEHGFSVSQADTILYGTCKNCTKESL